MNTDSNKVGVISGTLLLLAVLAGVFVLAWHKTFSGAEALAVVTTIVGIAGGAFAVHSGVNAGAKAANTDGGSRTTRRERLPE